MGLVDEVTGMFGVADEWEILADRAERVTVKHVDAAGVAVVRKISTVADAFAAEIAARTMLVDLGLPVAAPLTYRPDPPSILTLPWIEGTGIDPSTPTAVLEEVGALLAVVHAQPAGPPYAGNTTWSKWMRGWLSHATDWWDRTYPVERGRMNPLAASLITLADRMDAASKQTILFDGRPEHFIVHGIRLHLIDTEELRAGDPAMDFAVLRIWSPETVSSIVSGYLRAGGHVGPAFEERVRFYATLRALAAAEWHSSVIDRPLLTARFVESARTSVGV